jgi:hypothetical protein
MMRFAELEELLEANAERPARELLTAPGEGYAGACARLGARPSQKRCLMRSSGLVCGLYRIMWDRVIELIGTGQDGPRLV